MQINLKTGTLNIETNYPQILEKLTGFASRPNKKRGFVFVSKVLGHRYPTKPSIMKDMYTKLAVRIREQLDNQPTLVIGLAEAAVGLGCGIYHQLGLPNAFYMHTTYYRLSQPIWTTFQEEHSHAPTHLVYDTPLSELRDRVKNVVIIDDEFSTGKTLLNFVYQLKQQLPLAERFIGAAILDWIPNKLPDIGCVSLHKGSYTFNWKPNLQLDNPAVAVGTQEQILDQIMPHNFGRLGLQVLNIKCQNYVNIDQFRDKKVLILGTGECMYPAFLIGEYLETGGVEVYVQTTSRAPYNVDNDLKSKLTFKDNYYENIDNFFYNPKPYDSILICYETTSLPKNHNLPMQLSSFAPEIITLFVRS